MDFWYRIARRAPTGSPPEEDALFDLIGSLVEQYDERRHPLKPTTPLRMACGFMESRG